MWSGKIYKHHIELRTGGAEMAVSWLLFHLVTFNNIRVKVR
jgi:hypothetical protein